MDGDLYDEFGNYIGPDLESDEEDENIYASELGTKSHFTEEEEDEDMTESTEQHGMEITGVEDDDDGPTSNAVVLHEV